MADFDDFIKYCKMWSDPKLVKEIQDFTEKFFKKQANITLGDVVQNTPEDTGALKAAWVLKDYEKNADSFKIDFFNGQDYASFIEYGTVERKWKWKDGAFMLNKALNRALSRINDEYEKEFTKFLKSKGLV